MSKYDWSSVPDWVNWIFTDQDGDVFGCDNKPHADSGFHGHTCDDRWEYLGDGDRDNWKNSLEGRPNE